LLLEGGRKEPIKNGSVWVDQPGEKKRGIPQIPRGETETCRREENRPENAALLKREVPSAKQPKGQRDCIKRV